MSASVKRLPRSLGSSSHCAPYSGGGEGNVALRLLTRCPRRYSDSDDEDRSPDFKRPQWAESPELRAALAEQAYRDPDELFGPIKPISMEELFKVRQGKFRARTSSANWAKGDGLTRAEEVEYARRMGFRPIGQGSQGSGV